MLAGALMIAGGALNAQTAADSALKGVSAVEAQVRLVWDAGIPSAEGLSESRAKTAMETRFSLELRKLGIRVAVDVPQLLFCNVTLLNNNGTVFLSWTSRFAEVLPLARQADRPIWATLWSVSGVSFTKPGNLSDALEDSARRCAETFGNAWLAMNPIR